MGTGFSIGQVDLHYALGRSIDELPLFALSAQTSNAMELGWKRFGRFLVEGHGVTRVHEATPDRVRSFVTARHDGGAKPSISAMHWRRSAVRLLFRIWRQLGIADSDPTLDLTLPRRSQLTTRALTDDEGALCRWAALATAIDTRLPAVWALAESGATTGEIATVRAVDVDCSKRWVRLAGTTRTEPRTARLTEWGASQLTRRIAMHQHEPSAPLLYDGSASSASAQASVSGAVGDILRRAGLGDEPDVRPRSVTAWAGRRVFDETHRIEDVATSLGLRSLDRAAALIGWDWRP